MCVGGGWWGLHIERNVQDITFMDVARAGVYLQQNINENLAITIRILAHNYTQTVGGLTRF